MGTESVRILGSQGVSISLWAESNTHTERLPTGNSVILVNPEHNLESERAAWRQSGVAAEVKVQSRGVGLICR